MEDFVQELSERIRQAAATKQPLVVHGGRTKDFYGETPVGTPLDMRPLTGIVDYQPTELVITACAGTRLSDIEAAMRDRGQMLAFEPPHFGADATLGGAVASGLSGPRRPYAGAARDLVLGVRMLDGKGTDLRFGGQVMKNVAGYDLSRFVVGSMGTLGVLLEVSLKALPLPPAEATLTFECSEADSITRVNAWAGKALPISATSWHDGVLRLRLSGSNSAVRAAQTALGGETVNESDARQYWSDIREQRHEFFEEDVLPLWRLSVRSSAGPLPLKGRSLHEWGGALRWMRTTAAPGTIRDIAAQAGGHATLFRASEKSSGVFHPLAAPVAALHKRLKSTFDPAGILNRGRLYPGL